MHDTAASKIRNTHIARKMEAKRLSCSKESELKPDEKGWQHDIADAKGSVDSDAKAAESDDEDTERDWKQAARNDAATKVADGGDAGTELIAAGFRIDHIIMGDATTGKKMWESSAWDADALRNCELEAHIPASILKCRAVSRQVIFSSAHKICEFHLVQQVFLDNHCIEEWTFWFGFVIPGSTNTWEQTIVGKDQMLKAEDISGRVRIQTKFYDGEALIAQNNIRLYYDP